MIHVKKYIYQTKLRGKDQAGNHRDKITEQIFINRNNIVESKSNQN